MQKDILDYWKEYKLILFVCGPWFFGAIFVTLFYYALAFALTNWLLGGMNFYIQGILAGLTGGAWGYGLNKLFKKSDEIEKNIDKYSNKKYNQLIKKSMHRTLMFLGLILLEFICIWFFRLY